MFCFMIIGGEVKWWVILIVVLLFNVLMLLRFVGFLDFVVKNI